MQNPTLVTDTKTTRAIGWGTLPKTIVRKVHKSVEQRGLFATIRKCVAFPLDQFIRHARPWTPAGRKQKREEAEFDQRFNIDTSQDNDSGWMAGIESENWKYGTGYEGAPIRSLTQTLDRLSLDYGEFTFIDFGSGKARSLFVAAQFSFKKIIGVEFCPKLHSAAESNLNTFCGTSDGCKNLEVVYGDAAAFKIPIGPLVLFFNQPFDAPVFKIVIDNNVLSLSETPRKIFVVYYDPQCADLFPDSVFKQVRRNGNEYVIFESR